MRRWLPLLPLAGLALGLLHHPLWHAAATLPVLLWVLAGLWGAVRRGEWGLDLIAVLSMGFALALGEGLAANVIALMVAGGNFLEDHAQRRAGAEMAALLARQPRTALRHGPAGIEEVPIAALSPGDRVLVPRGAVLPADAVLEDARALLDTAAITGESVPRAARRGDALLSGFGNAGDAFTARATTDAAGGTYAAILRLVEQARAARAPMARLADRWALGFLGFTLALAGGAWAATGEAQRALAVLVVATPCPLILAVPVALMAGVSRCAALGVLVKSPAAVEALARIRVVVLDKTGTLTTGRPELAPDADRESLRVAAALDQGSTHPVARALVAAAEARGLAPLPVPEALREVPGEGVSGRLDGTACRAGAPGFVGHPWPDAPPGAQVVAVARGDAALPPLILRDAPRPEAAAALAALAALGVRRFVLASGDAPGPVAALARELRLPDWHAGLSPADKAALVAALRDGGPVLMLGDGVNDAPALAAADLGVAVGTGGAAAAEAADAVLLADGIGALPAALAAAHRAVAVARQSVVAGIGLSALGMMAGALGWLTPVQGALLQEGIDVAVILHALRALR